jgi:ankyrin repeat protein
MPMHELDLQLWSAVKPGNAPIVQALLREGADPNYRGSGGLTSVHRACLLDCSDQLELLVNAGGSLALGDDDGETPIHLAAREGNTAIIERLLALGSDAQQQSDYGIPLDRAAYGGYASAVAALLNSGVPITAQNSWGRTPLHEACRYGRLEATRLLLRRGAEPDAVDHFGNNRTPLHEAVAPGDGPIVELLLIYGANIHHRNSWGATPLHMAARMGARDVVKVLLRAGADPAATDYHDRRPEDEAAERNYSDVIDLLKAPQTKFSPEFTPREHPALPTTALGPRLERYQRARRLLLGNITRDGFRTQEELDLKSRVLGDALRDLGFRYHPDGEQRIKRNDEAERALRGGSFDETVGTVVASVPVLPLKSLLKLDRMSRRQDLLSKVTWMSPDDCPLLVIFVSHRWEWTSHPDPYGTQLQILKRFAAMFLDVAVGLKEPREKRGERIPTLSTHGALQAAYFVGAIADYIDAFHVDETELREQLLARVGIVYDFLCLPQSPRSQGEYAEFLEGMRTFRRLMQSLPMLVLRYPDDEYDTRSWCALEFWSACESSRSFQSPVVLRVDKWGKELEVQKMGPPDSYTSSTNYLSVICALAAWERNEEVTARHVAGTIMANYRLAFSWREKESATPLVVRPDFRVDNETNISKTPRSFRFWHSVCVVLCNGIEDEDFRTILETHLSAHGIRCTDEWDLVTTALWLLATHGLKDFDFQCFYGRCLLRHFEGKDLKVNLFYRASNALVHFKFADGEESLEGIDRIVLNLPPDQTE